MFFECSTPVLFLSCCVANYLKCSGWNNTKISVGQKSSMVWLDFLLRVSPLLNSRYPPGLSSHLGLTVLFQLTGHWQNSVLSCCRSEVPISWLSVSWCLLSALRAFSCGPLRTSSSQPWFMQSLSCFQSLWLPLIPSSSATWESSLLLRPYVIKLDPLG